MKQIYKIFVLVLLIAFSGNGLAATIWVGSSTACTGSSVQASLVQALFITALNGQASNEIRLTNTVSHTGNTNGNHTLTDRISAGFGTLTIVGGYADCFTSPSGRTVVGDSGTSSFTVNTSTQTNSVITLKNLELSGNASRGLVVRSGGIVTLDNVVVSSNGFSGVDIGDGGYVEILANSVVRENDNFSNPTGGGVRCTGTNSSVVIHGNLEKNRASRGGNLFVSTGCYAELKDGMRVIGADNIARRDAIEGGGVYVDDGGSLFADGRANRVIFDANVATKGGALYLNGTGFALLQNTHINNSSANEGSAIYAMDGGAASQQLIMGQTTTCDLLFRCSEIQNSRHGGTVVDANNSFVQISRTVVELSHQTYSSDVDRPLIYAGGGAKVRLNRVGMLRNEGYAMLGSLTTGSVEATHVTIAANQTLGGQNSKSVWLLNSSINIQNSLISQAPQAELIGLQNSFTGSCNLIDGNTNWPSGIYHTGTAQMINAVAGDARQLASSPGVDMCQQDSFSWSSEVDIENQIAPVNESTNPQGMPGDVGGLYDAGFDEVYDNIGNDTYLLSVTKEGSGNGIVINNTGAISCGTFCSAIFEDGTMVSLGANPDSDSVFTAWNNCPSVSGNLCFIQINGNLAVSAEFSLKPSNHIFSDSFE